MKTIISLSFLALATCLSAQIKIFPGGLQSYGSTTAPTGSVKHRFSGDVVVGQTASSTESAYIRGNNTVSSSSTPDYTWLSNTNTGLFHPTSNTIGFTTGGVEKWRINSTGQLLSSIAQATATPVYSWSSDANTGIYNPTADVIGFVTNATEKFRINLTGQILCSTANASATTPDYSWSTDANTGMYRKANDVLCFATSGAEALQIYSNNKLYAGIQPNTGALWSDGQLNLKNGSINESVLVLTHASNADWKGSMTTFLDRGNSTAYGVALSGNTTFYVAGSGWIYSQGNYLGSDITIKDDIKLIDSASAKINKIKGVTYTYKKEKQNPSVYGATAKEYMGVIAQDVEKVAPQAVKTVHDGTKAVSYEMLVGLLIEGFKEQSAKVAQLEADLNACCSKNGGGKTTERSIHSSSANDENTINDTQSFIKQNKPNPFSNETVIEYNIVSKSNTSSIMIFDMNGKFLKTYHVKKQGKGQITINGKELSAGLYHYSLVVDGQEIDTKKMIITE